MAKLILCAVSFLVACRSVPQEQVVLDTAPDLSGPAVVGPDMGDAAVSTLTSEDVYCAQAFRGTFVCPDDRCERGCGPGGEGGGGYPVACYAKSCAGFDAAHCPTSRCQLWTDCANEQICHDIIPLTPPANNCGGLTYYPPNPACCAGLTRVCRRQKADDSCSDGRYEFPTCMPCGNGICDSGEDVCNCPADCPR